MAIFSDMFELSKVEGVIKNPRSRVRGENGSYNSDFLEKILSFVIHL